MKSEEIVKEQAPPAANRLPGVWAIVIAEAEAESRHPNFQHADVAALVIADMKARDDEGHRKYGVALQPFNGRDPLVDLYQELLDAAVYSRQAMIEREAVFKDRDTDDDDIGSEIEFLHNNIVTMLLETRLVMQAIEREDSDD